MAGGNVARGRNGEYRTKVRTGCATCRIRKIKCDEDKPSCQRCVKTGRTCDGYESPFRVITSHSLNTAHAGGVKSDGGIQLTEATANEITSQDIDLLNRYFSTKTMLDVKMGCDKEAQQVLQASLTDPCVRRAVSSLRALRENLETSGDYTPAVVKQTPSYEYGLQLYSMALGGTATNLSSLGSNGLKSALLCCQIFISIEQVQANYASMAVHIVRGIGIMHEYGARPTIVASDKLIPAHHGQLPLLDVFVIKLFAAPCKFAILPATADNSAAASSGCPIQGSIASPDLRRIAPDKRTELTRIAASTLELLGKISQVKSLENGLRLLSKKVALLEALELWLVDLERVLAETRPSDSELLPVAFQRLFHRILKLILTGALESSPSLDTQRRIESERLQAVADDVGERVKSYRLCNWANSGRGEQYKGR